MSIPNEIMSAPLPQQISAMPLQPVMGFNPPIQPQQMQQMMPPSLLQYPPQIRISLSSIQNTPSSQKTKQQSHSSLIELIFIN